MSSAPRARVVPIGEALFADLTERARQSPRLRVNHNFHTSAEDNPHRFLNVMCRGTYVTPHRHLAPPKSESFLVLAGALTVVVFDDDGAIAELHRLGVGSSLVGVDLLPGVYHSLVVESDVAVCFEVKPGPYRADDDKSFAPFAPREGSEGAAAYLAHLEALIASRR